MLLISSPSKAWEEISLEKDKDRQKVFVTFVYPMIGLCGLSVFVGSLLAKGWSGPESFQYAMTQCCAVAVSLFGGYFLAAYLINAMRTGMLQMSGDIALAQQFAPYHYRRVAGLQRHRVAVAVLHRICGVGRNFHIDESGRKRPVTFHHPLFCAADCLPLVHPMDIQQTDDST